MSIASPAACPTATAHPRAHLRRRGELKPRNIVASVVAVAFLIVPAIGSVYSVPPPPGNWHPYAFALYVACGVTLLWRRRATSTAADPAIAVTEISLGG